MREDHGDTSPTVSQNTGAILTENARTLLKKIVYMYMIFFPIIWSIFYYK